MNIKTWKERLHKLDGGEAENWTTLAQAKLADGGGGMNLLDEIDIAQRDAGEAAVIASLQRQGLIPPEPLPMSPQGIIIKLEGEAKVLRELLLECTNVISEIDAESSDEADMLDSLHSKIIKALTGAPS